MSDTHDMHESSIPAVDRDEENTPRTAPRRGVT